MDNSAPKLLPVMRPKLPSAGKIAPYLEEIDSSQIYTNFGPLSQRLEKRLADRFGVPPGSVVTMANGTLALMLAIRALEPKIGTIGILPSFTFTATPGALVACGLTPWLVDVDADSWSLTPEIVERLLPEAPGEVGMVVPVSAFGRPVDVDAWDRFTERTGIPVVIDGAASFDAAKVGRTPLMISLHATKIYGSGEGGLLLSNEELLIDAARCFSNFGFGMDQNHSVTIRNSMLPGINAKFSEYSAAVGLAALDEFDQTRAALLELAAQYREVMADIPDLVLQEGFGGDWISATINFRLKRLHAVRFEEGMRKLGIHIRRWWGDGCHRFPAFSAVPRGDLAVTEQLIDSVVGLPFFVGMTRAQVVQVRDAAEQVIRAWSR